MAAQNQSFIIPESIEIARLSHLIARDHPVKVESPDRWMISYYDSFDWRLFRKGLFLAREGHCYRLGSFATNETIAEATCEEGARPRLWQDFPLGELRARLQAVLSIRALLHLMRVEKLVQTLHLHDSGGSPVVRADLVRSLLLRKTDRTDLGQHIVIQADRKHTEQWQQFRIYLQRLGVSQPADDSYRTALAAAGLDPRTPGKKLDFQLRPEMPSAQAIAIIVRHFLHTMKRNEAGLKADIDTEFLHDYRVACRRARSLVGQCKSVFPPQMASDLQRDLALQGRMSNRLRDLDVYLLKEAKYRLMLTDSLQQGLDVLFQDIGRERRREHAQVAQAVSDPVTVGAFNRWRSLFATQQPFGPQAGKHASSPIRQVARRRIRRRIRRVLKAGDAITDASTDRRMHRLRIQAKKLRYLLECFASLFPPQEIARLIKQLKLLQDNLGDFNDLVVQQGELTGYLARGRSLKGDPVIVAAAVGGLITQLQNEQLRLRREFAPTYLCFARPRNRVLFARLFGDSN